MTPTYRGVDLGPVLADALSRIGDLDSRVGCAHTTAREVHGGLARDLDNVRARTSDLRCSFARANALARVDATALSYAHADEIAFALARAHDLAQSVKRNLAQALVEAQRRARAQNGGAARELAQAYAEDLARATRLEGDLSQAHLLASGLATSLVWINSRRWGQAEVPTLLAQLILRMAAAVLPPEHRERFISEETGNLACAESSGEWVWYLIGQLVGLAGLARECRGWPVR